MQFTTSVGCDDCWAHSVWLEHACMTWLTRGITIFLIFLITDTRFSSTFTLDFSTPASDRRALCVISVLYKITRARRKPDTSHQQCSYQDTTHCQQIFYKHDSIHVSNWLRQTPVFNVSIGTIPVELVRYRYHQQSQHWSRYKTGTSQPSLLCNESKHCLTTLCRK